MRLRANSGYFRTMKRNLALSMEISSVWFSIAVVVADRGESSTKAVSLKNHRPSARSGILIGTHLA